MQSQSLLADNQRVISENKLSTQEKWRMLFSSLLAVPLENADFEVKVDDDLVYFTTTNEARMLQAVDVFRSPDLMRDNLGYLLTRTNQATSNNPKMAHYPLPMTLTPNCGVKLYGQIFGDDTLRQFGQINWQGEVNGDEARHVLQGVNNAAYRDFELQKIAIYKEILASASFADLRAAFANHPQDYKPLPLKRTCDGVLASNIDKMMYFNYDKTRIYLDYGLILKCISSPLLESTSDNSTYTLSFSKTHLINYFSIIFNEGFVFHVQGERGTPILFSTQRTMPLKHVFSLILDCSGSMESVKDRYLQEVSNFLNELSRLKEFADAEIRITHFSDDANVRQFSASDMQVMQGHIKGLPMAGCTKLNLSVGNELKNLMSRARENENVIVVAFTDGDDTGTPDDLNCLKSVVHTINNKEGMRPRVFTMGLGQHHDAEKLQTLADITGGSYIHLNKISDFQAIFAHIQEMTSVKEFISFIQNEVASFVTPAYANDLSVASHSLTIPGTFSVANQQYQVSAQAPKIVADVDEIVDAMSPRTMKAEFARLLRQQSTIQSEDKAVSLRK